jgi:hypothetical protein
MIVPGKDDNYPGSAFATGSGSGMWSFMPHTVVGILLALIILLIAWNLLKGTRRRRR